LFREFKCLQTDRYSSAREVGLYEGDESIYNDIGAVTEVPRTDTTGVSQSVLQGEVLAGVSRQLGLTFVDMTKNTDTSENDVVTGVDIDICVRYLISTR